MAELVGKSGSLMSAVLETAGYMYQAEVLKQLEAAFSGSVGGFIFLIGIVVALIAFTVHGSFKMAPWLLIGPPMFFAVILPRTSIPQVQWKFGQDARDQARVERRVQEMTKLKNGQTIQVSKLFARYVNLVSETTQEIVARMGNARNREDLMMVFRGDMLSFLYSTQVEESDFSAFLHDAFFFRCRNYIHAAYVVQNDQFTQQEKAAANLILGPGMRNFREDRFVSLVNNPRAARFATIARIIPVPIPVFGAGPAPVAGQLYNQIAMNENFNAARQNLSCSEVWDLTILGLRDVARRRINRINEQARANEIPPQRMLNYITHAIFGGSVQTSPDQGSDVNAASIDRLVRTASLYLLRNEYLDQSDAPRITRGSNNQGDLAIEVVDHFDFYQTERARVASIEWAEKTRLMSSAESLPYFQGLALYFLGFSFPFFALLLLIPGKHPGFLLWFVLWLWVKSWDVGIAVVALLDKLLFGVLGYQQEARPPNAQELPDQFANAMLNLMTLDPTFQLGTYYNILAASLMSIPVISSQLIMGGLTGGAGLISSGMGQIAQTIAGGAQVAQQQTTVSQLRLQSYNIRNNQAEAINAIMWNQAATTPDQRQRYFNGSQQYRSDVLEFGFEQADNLSNAPGAPSPIGNGNANAARTNLRNNGGAVRPGAPVPVTGRGFQLGLVNRAFSNPVMAQQTMRNYQALMSDATRLNATYQAMEEIRTGGFQGGPGVASRSGIANELWSTIDANWRSLGIGSDYQLRLYRNATEQLGVSQAVLDHNLRFAINYSAEIQRLAGTARVWGMLEVPWTVAPPSTTDDDYLRQARTAQVRRYIGALNAAADLYDAASGSGNQARLDIVAITQLLQGTRQRNGRALTPLEQRTEFQGLLERYLGHLQLDSEAIDHMLQSPLVHEFFRGLRPDVEGDVPANTQQQLPSIAHFLSGSLGPNIDGNRPIIDQLGGPPNP